MPQKKQLAQYDFTVADFLTADECDDLIQPTETLGYTEAPVNTPGDVPTIAKGIRNNDRVMFDHADRAESLWRHARPFCPESYKGHSVR